MLFVSIQYLLVVGLVEYVCVCALVGVILRGRYVKHHAISVFPKVVEQELASVVKKYYPKLMPNGSFPSDKQALRQSVFSVCASAGVDRYCHVGLNIYSIEPHFDPAHVGVCGYCNL